MESYLSQAFSTLSSVNYLRLINIDALQKRLQNNRLREALSDSSGSRHIAADEPAGMF